MSTGAPSGSAGNIRPPRCGARQPVAERPGVDSREGGGGAGDISMRRPTASEVRRQVDVDRRLKSRRNAGY